MVETDQKYPSNGGMVNQPSVVPTMGIPAQYINPSGMGCVMSGMLYVLICCQFWTPCVYSCTFRAKIRSKFGLPDAPAPDWITHCFCEYCALCQEYRELKNRGLDPSIGKLSTVYEKTMMTHAFCN
ncbi:hypothetical protein BRARA_E01713 [Brassica rapa]|uniref:Uncharacterized protein n=1 Tax=Brassica campestris TaxID=3711 RepID=A0A397ZED2_BRACM|nr:hypothetical protein BRARA_E01713 [Brassica rapa]